MWRNVTRCDAEQCGVGGGSRPARYRGRIRPDTPVEARVESRQGLSLFVKWDRSKVGAP